MPRLLGLLCKGLCRIWVLFIHKRKKKKDKKNPTASCLLQYRIESKKGSQSSQTNMAVLCMYVNGAVGGRSSQQASGSGRQGPTDLSPDNEP